MKRFFLTLPLALTTMLMFAIPAKRGSWKTVRLTDGTEIKVELRGDEFCSFWQAADGRKFVKNTSTGYYEAADINSMRAKAEAKRSMRNSSMLRRAPGIGSALGKSTVDYTGKKKGLIILVQFSDKKFKDEHTQEYYNRCVNEIGYNNPSIGFIGSVKDYFLAQSNNKMEFDFDVMGPVTLSNGYAHYGRNDAYGSDANVGEMVREACEAIKSQLTEEQVKQYDWDGDGTADQIYLLYAGYGEATSPHEENTIWPHMFYLRRGYGITYRLHGVLIDTYACSNEVQLKGSNDAAMGIGTICHEFSHCLGLPDTYDTGYSGNYGTDDWDLMCSGCYNGDTFIPAGYTAYEKMAAGWQQPIELNSSQSVNGMQPISSNGDTYIIYNEGNKDEYYMLENRKQEGWDAGIPGSGLLITHIDYDDYYWNANTVNNTAGHERIGIIPADNSKKSSDNATDVYPYGMNNSLTSSSTPAATLFNKNKDGFYNMNKPVRNITKNSDGTISFTFENDNNNNDDYTLPQSYTFYESFDKCAGTGGNDDNFSATTSGSPVYDNSGWKSPSSRQADKCALYGSTTVAGQVTSPEITVNGDYTLLFKAAPYAQECNSLSVEIAEGTGKLSKTTFALSANRWSAFSTEINANGPIKLRFFVNTSKGRFYLDKVCVTNDTSAGIDGVTTDGGKTSENRIYSIDGRYMGKDMNALKKGIYIINGKKIVK